MSPPICAALAGQHHHSLYQWLGSSQDHPLITVHLPPSGLLIAEERCNRSSETEWSLNKYQHKYNLEKQDILIGAQAKYDNHSGKRKRMMFPLTAKTSDSGI